MNYITRRALIRHAAVIVIILTIVRLLGSASAANRRSTGGDVDWS